MLSCKDGDKTALISGALNEHFVIKIFVLSIFEWPFYRFYCEVDMMNSLPA